MAAHHGVGRASDGKLTMLKIKVEVTGMEDLARNLNRISDKSRANIEDALDESAHAMRDDVLRSILHEEKTGRVYRRGNIEHQASAPGEAPASDTGFLVSRISADRSRLPMLDAGVVSDAPYSEALEYRPPQKGGRPFLRPSLLRMEEPIVARITEALRAALRSARRRR